MPQATHDFLVPRDVQVKVISRTASHKIPGFVTQHVYYFGDCCCFFWGAGCVWKLGAFETTFVLGPKVVHVHVCIEKTLVHFSTKCSNPAHARWIKQKKKHH